MASIVDLPMPFEALRCEIAQNRMLEEGLRQQISARSAALKQEEVVIRKQLDGLLIKSEMLRCEHSSLEAILRDDRVWVVHQQAWYISAVKASKSAALERMDQNVWMASETARLQTEIDASERDDRWRAGEVLDAGDDEAALAWTQVVREANGRFASHSEHILQCLETNAQIGREQYTRATEQAGKDVTALRGGIVAMRNYLREVHHQASVANELIVWAETGGRVARSKARWDFQHPICPLDLVILEGLRLRLADLI